VLAVLVATDAVVVLVFGCASNHISTPPHSKPHFTVASLEEREKTRLGLSTDRLALVSNITVVERALLVAVSCLKKRKEKEKV
jgi:hypothetical protein